MLFNVFAVSDVVMFEDISDSLLFVFAMSSAACDSKSLHDGEVPSVTLHLRAVRLHCFLRLSLRISCF